MLKRTFIHLDGVGPRREADFWRQGVGTWDDFLGAPRLSGLSWERLRRLQEELRESVRQAADPAYFAARLAAGEHWRLFRAFTAPGWLPGHRNHRRLLAGAVGHRGGPL